MVICVTAHDQIKSFIARKRFSYRNTDNRKLGMGIYLVVWWVDFDGAEEFMNVKISRSRLYMKHWPMV